MQEFVWIDWEISCRRSRELCNYFQIEPSLLNSALPGKLGLVELMIRTICVLFKTRPYVLTVASLRIALLAILLKPVFRYFLVVDCHYAGVIPSSNIPRFLQSLYSYIHRNADLILVTNKPHADIVRTSGGRPLILQDRIPTPVSFNNSVDSSEKKSVVFICSYNTDEPIDEIISAAKLLGDKDISIYLTGDSRDTFSQNEIPGNVILTGYLSDENYWQLLWEADLIVDLTTRENCLLCGAYEAVAVEKPMVLSNTAALRGYFTKGVVYTENRDSDIALSIKSALGSIDHLVEEVKELKDDLKLTWEPLGKNFKEKIQDICKSKKNFSTRSIQGS